MALKISKLLKVLLKTEPLVKSKRKSLENKKKNKKEEKNLHLIYLRRCQTISPTHSPPHRSHVAIVPSTRATRPSGERIGGGSRVTPTCRGCFLRAIGHQSASPVRLALRLAMMLFFGTGSSFSFSPVPWTIEFGTGSSFAFSPVPWTMLFGTGSGFASCPTMMTSGRPEGALAVGSLVGFFGMWPFFLLIRNQISRKKVNS